MFKGNDRFPGRSALSLSTIAKAVTSLALVLLIGGLLFSTSGVWIHAASPPLAKPLLLKGLKQREGNWFQLSHFGKQKPSIDALLKAHMQANALPTASATTKWVQLGPKPINAGQLVSGRITAEAVNPLNTSEVWVGGADGGLWHSTTGGKSWTPTWPLSSPSDRCCRAKYFCERFAKKVVTNTLGGRVRTTTRDSKGLMVSIITITPMSVTAEVINCVRLCCKVVLMLSV